jgi:alpha-tubulin suppressor-like RCC1 family protein
MGRNEEGQLLNCSFSSADMPHRCEILLRVVSESRPSAARRDEMDDASEGPDVNLESNGQNKEGCVADIACGQYFTVVLMSHGEVLVGGDNSCGQLGLGTMVLGMYQIFLLYTYRCTWSCWHVHPM